MGIETIIYWVIAIIAVVALTPRPQNNTKPATLDDIQAPTAEDGREIPVLFGTRLLSGPNVVWYGDLRTQAIKSKGGKK